MALQTVNVYIQNTDPVPVAVPDVTVRFFLGDDTTFVTEAVSDVNGLASTTLDDAEATYVLRFYRHGVAIPQPQEIIMAPPWPLEIDVTAETFGRPSSPDPALCRVSGHLRNVYGMAPERQLRLKFKAIRDPAIQQLDPQVLTVNPEIDILADRNGYVAFDLYRGSVHDVLAPGWYDKPLVVEVPDRPWLDLVDLILPTPALVDFEDDDPTPPLSMAVGDAATFHPRVKLSNDIWFLDNRMDYVDLNLEVSSDDPAVATVNEDILAASGEFVITAVAPGTATITVAVTNVDKYFAKRVPEYPAQPATVQVTVT